MGTAWKEGTMRPGTTLFDPAVRGGTCRVEGCENPARSPRAYTCEDCHQAREADKERDKQAKAEKASRRKAEAVEAVVTGEAPPPKSTPRSGRSKQERELADWLGFVLVILTTLVAQKAAGGTGLLLKGADPELAKRLNMTDDQADNICRVLAKKLAPTRLYQRQGERIIQTLDLELIACLESVWEWGSTIAPYLAPKRVHREAERVVREATAGEPAQTGGMPGVIVDAQPPPTGAPRPGGAGFGGFPPAHRLDD